MNIPQQFKNFVKSRLESLSARIYLTLICSIVIISFFFTAFFIHYQKKSRTDILINKGELLAGQLAENARIGVFAENSELLVDPLRAVMRQQEVLDVKIFTTDGKLLAEQKKSAVSRQRKLLKPDSEEEQKFIQQLGKSRKAVYQSREGSIDFWAPVQYETNYAPADALFFTDEPLQPTIQTVGFVRLVLDKTQLQQSFELLLINSILLTAVFLVLCSILTYFVTKSIIRPLNRLKEGVYALETGVSFEPIPVMSNDEIGKLAAAFNAMAESIKMRVTEKEQLSKQLLQAQKMEAIGTLAGGIAHDFNNILTAIIGYAYLILLKTTEDDPLNSHTRQIQQAAERAAELTQGLLAFSRKQVLVPRALNLNEVVAQLHKMLRRLIMENIDLHQSQSLGELVVMADRVKIEQVLMNLVTNASDAMPNGGRLDINTSCITLNSEFLHTHGYGVPGEYACISVSDTGCGMDENETKKIFEPFFTTKEVGKGTGLGLSIVYGIVKQHDGYINVSSEPGKGTTFTIYLPLIKSLIDQNPAAGIADNSLLPGGTETLLLAEDDPAVGNFHRTLLEGVGYRVITATDGQKALEKFVRHENEIDLLVLDVIMPKMNGKQVFDIIGKSKPGMNALFLSGYSADVLDKAGITPQQGSHMFKPVNPGELLRRVRQMLDQANGRSE
jgi:signal transduction histidine kinase/CheY-like chemotaxis protein